MLISSVAAARNHEGNYRSTASALFHAVCVPLSAGVVHDRCTRSADGSSALSFARKATIEQDGRMVNKSNGRWKSRMNDPNSPQSRRHFERPVSAAHGRPPVIAAYRSGASLPAPMARTVSAERTDYCALSFRRSGNLPARSADESDHRAMLTCPRPVFGEATVFSATLSFTLAC